MKSKLTTVLCIGLIPMLFAFPADAASPGSPITYNATLLNISGESVANGINDVGEIVGGVGASPLGKGNKSGFIYSGGSITNTLNDDNGFNTQAYGINNGHQVVGALNVPGATNTYAAGINPGASEIVGWWDSGSANASSGFIYNNGSYTSVNVPGSTSTKLRALSTTQVRSSGPTPMR